MSLNPEQYAIIIIPFLMWLFAQIIKFMIYSLKHGVHWKYLFEYGHMPSSHTACVTALIFSVGYYTGIGSPIFAVAFTLGLLTIYDAVKLRAYIGDYGKTINHLIKEQGVDCPQLKERVGHTLGEAITGIFLGILGSLFLVQLFQIIS